MIRVIVSRTLELGGYGVELADCGARAMETLSAQPDAVELVITDLVMPGMSGQELIGAICERWPHIRIMWISAYTAEVVVAGGENCPNVVPGLTKPFEPTALLEAVGSVLA